MTVEKLIMELKKMPQYLEVICSQAVVEGCHINSEYYDGDCANPNCKIISVVELDY